MEGVEVRDVRVTASLKSISLDFATIDGPLLTFTASGTCGVWGVVWGSTCGVWGCGCGSGLGAVWARFGCSLGAVWVQSGRGLGAVWVWSSYHLGTYCFADLNAGIDVYKSRLDLATR